MAVTVCRLYDSYGDAVVVIEQMEAAGVPVEDTSIISNNSDGWFSGMRQEAGSGASAGSAAPSTAERIADDGTSADDGSTRATGSETITQPRSTASDTASESTRSDAAAKSADEDTRSGKFESAVMGAAIGATAATAGGLIASLGLLAVPGIGTAVGAGWLVTWLLAGAAAGGVTGGLLGALTAAGVSEEDAQVYAEGVRRGGTLVTARVPEADKAKVESVMDERAVDTGERREEYRRGGWRWFDQQAKPFTTEEVNRERALHAA